jgi:hypothetical protein
VCFVPRTSRKICDRLGNRKFKTKATFLIPCDRWGLISYQRVAKCLSPRKVLAGTDQVGNTYLLTPWSRVLLEKLAVNFAASQEIPRIYGTRKFLTVPTTARHSISTWVILNMYFLRRGVVSTSPNPQTGGPPLVCCLRLLI